VRHQKRWWSLRPALGLANHACSHIAHGRVCADVTSRSLSDRMNDGEPSTRGFRFHLAHLPSMFIATWLQVYRKIQCTQDAEIQFLRSRYSPRLNSNRSVTGAAGGAAVRPVHRIGGAARRYLALVERMPQPVTATPRRSPYSRDSAGPSCATVRDTPPTVLTRCSVSYAASDSGGGPCLDVVSYG
jgi:hypothetical protein